MKTGAGLVGFAAMASALPRAVFAQTGEWTLANSLRSLTNPYHASFAKGGEMFARVRRRALRGAGHRGQQREGHLGRAGAARQVPAATSALCIDPNDTPDTRVIVDLAKAGASVVLDLEQDRPICIPGTSTRTTSRTSAFDGAPYGKLMAETLIEKMGGSGGIVALGGIFNNTPAIERKQGLDEALAANSNVQLLDFQVADWTWRPSRSRSTQAWLTRFGSEVKGIWAANDSMALGAIEALRAEGLAGSSSRSPASSDP